MFDINTEKFSFYKEIISNSLFENHYVYKIIFNFKTVYDTKNKQRIWINKNDEMIMKEIKKDVLFKFPNDCLVKGKTIYCKTLDSAFYIKLKHYYFLKHIEKAVSPNKTEDEEIFI